MTEENNEKQGKQVTLSPEITIAFGSRIKSIRKELELTQKLFCQKIDVASSSYLSEIESGKTRPGFEFIYKLGLHYNVNPFYLLYGEEPKFVGKEPERDNELQKYEFGSVKEQIHELLYYATHCEPFKFALLSFFSGYKHDNKVMLEDHLKDAPEFKK